MAIWKKRILPLLLPQQLFRDCTPLGPLHDPAALMLLLLKPALERCASWQGAREIAAALQRQKLLDP
jgi:hypothetical protein